ncbi:phosphoglycerate mutase-like protein [Myriangium duriaei CBS 260.36]|uniref:Phytase A n=1 Tax=Myriangium duriaei CBS 260.36 TaxID=1168546 RepID=A0A9P4J9H9_9PEZI|nr:phosphoglycerate mutase-like protein [Myriangium duriaei CBS 260.36]
MALVMLAVHHILIFVAILGLSTGKDCFSSTENDRAERYCPSPGTRKCDDVHKGYRCKPKISQYWGNHSPFFSVESKLPRALPKECKVTFVQLLSRHGARYAIKRQAPELEKTIAQLQSTAKRYPGKYAFLKTYRYNLGVGTLTPFGEQQMINSGITFYTRYSDLARHTKPFFRTASGDRVVMSAQNFTQGFHRALSPTTPFQPYPILIIPEKSGQNNTLSHGACPAFEHSPHHGKTARSLWAQQFLPPIQRRINSALGTALSPMQTLSLMSMCPYTVAADPLGRPTPFCALFTRPEWRAYSLYATLSKYFRYGPPSPLGTSQGVGWVNELIARLTRSPVRDNTSTNRTLTGSRETFPLDRNMYADFSHDTDMAAVMFAMNLFPDVEPTMANIRVKEVFGADRTVPFAGRMYVEKMVCDTGRRWGKGEMVRVLVNDRVVKLKGCGVDRFGRCELRKWLESLAWVRKGGEWEKC